MAAGGPKLDLPPVEAALQALAAGQFGVFSAAQAEAAGVSLRTLSHRLHRGSLFRVHRGVYSLIAPRLLTEPGRHMAAVLACGLGAALSHRTAAIHTGFLPGTAPRKLDITVPSQNGRKRSELHVHRSATLRPADVIATYGIPTTTVPRTILDLAKLLTDDEIEEAIAEATRQDLLVIGDLSEQVAHNTGRPEAAKLQRILAHYDYLMSFTESQLEAMTLKALLSEGLPTPQLQEWIDPGDGGPHIRADFLYRQAKLILEADSWRWHANRLEQDSHRDQRTALAGYQTLRITRKQVITDLDRLAETIAGVYAQRTALLGAVR